MRPNERDEPSLTSTGKNEPHTTVEMKATMAIGSSCSSGFSFNDDLQRLMCFHPKLLGISKRDCLSDAMIARCMNGALFIYVSFCGQIRHYPTCSAYCTHCSRARVDIHQLLLQPLDGITGGRDIAKVSTFILQLNH